MIKNTEYDTKRLNNRIACKKYREKNLEKIKEKLKILRLTDEFRKKRNLKLKEKRQKGETVSKFSIKEREYQKIYRLKNPDKIKLYQKKYRLLNHDKRKLRKRKDKEQQRKNITNEYVKILLRNKLGIPYSEVKKYPQLIELHKQIIKIKRYAKQNKN